MDCRRVFIGLNSAGLLTLGGTILDWISFVSVRLSASLSLTFFLYTELRRDETGGLGLVAMEERRLLEDLSPSLVVSTFFL
jgi:hypothetical protein